MGRSSALFSSSALLAITFFLGLSLPVQAGPCDCPSDNTPPVISDLPAPSTIECPATPQFATPTATDACDPNPSLTFADVTTPGNCPQAYSVTRTWTATDHCGNSATASQTINVEDKTPPVISGVGAGATIQCPATPVFSNPTATDVCDPNPTLTFADVNTPGRCPQEYSITRTWTATDHCGNSSTASQTINVVDNTPPVISSLPAPSTIECPATPQFATPTATDACDPNPTLTFADVTTPGSCPQAYSVTRTWTATDHCGNSSQKSQTINVEDKTPPVIFCPTDITIDPNHSPCCGIANFNVTATDACDPSAQVACDNPPDLCFPVGITTVHCWAVDACGNQSGCSFAVTVNDVKPLCAIMEGVGYGEPICAGSGVPIIDLFCGPNGMASYNWSVNCGSIDGSNTSQCVSWIPPASGGSCTFTLNITDNNGCASTCTRDLSVPFISPCALTPPATSPICGSAGNSYCGQAGYANYQWSFSSPGDDWVITGGQGTQCITYTAGLSCPATLLLDATNTFGCHSSCEVSISCQSGTSVQGIHILSIEKSADGISYQTFSPLNLDSVTASNYLRIRGIAGNASQQPLAGAPIVVYNSVNYNPYIGKIGIDTVFTNCRGEFVYPDTIRIPSGFQANRDGFFPFWFANCDSIAVPFLLKAGKGCDCSAESLKQMLATDTSIHFDKIAIIKDTSDPLAIRLTSYPINDSNLLDVSNNQFIKGYFSRYFGPKDRQFLQNLNQTGWLDLGLTYLRQPTDSILSSPHTYLDNLISKESVLVVRDTTGNLILCPSNVSLPSLFKLSPSSSLTVISYGLEIAQCGLGLAAGGAGAVLCVPLILSLSRDLVVRPTIQNLACNNNPNREVCRSSYGKKVDNAYFFTKTALSFMNPSTGLVGAIKSVSFGVSTSKYILDNSQSRFVRNQKGRIQSHQVRNVRTTTPRRSFSVDAIATDEDTTYFDFGFTLTSEPLFSVAGNWDDQANPQNLNLQIGATAILFLDKDTLETLADLRLVHSGDTVNIFSVIKMDDSTYTASIPISSLPNYIPGKKYTATLITSGQDLFGNYGEERQSVALAEITINGDEIITQEKWKLSIPSGALTANTFVTMIPAASPAVGTFASRAFTISNPHFLGDIVAVTPTNLVMNSPAYLTLPFDTTEYKNLVDSTIVLARFDSTQGWRSLGGTVNSDSGLVTASIQQFGIFAVLVFPDLGDLNRDKRLTPADVVLELACVFLAQGDCASAPADVNCDGNLTPADVVLELNAVFLALPFPCP